MGSISADWEEQLMVLRGLTASTGALHEAQKTQLQYWGALTFGRTGWEVHVDMERREVLYKVAQVKTSPRAVKQLAVLVAGLDRSVHWLLGPEWALRVHEGKKVVYAGAREVAPGEQVHERRANAGIHRS